MIKTRQLHRFVQRRRADDQVVRRFAAAQVTALTDYEIDVILCTSTANALDGDIWDMAGIDLSRFNSHPVVLWNHDMAEPIGRASNLVVTPAKITARVTFPADGVSAKADEIRKLVKSGIITGVSTGIIPTETKPLDPRNPRGGDRVTKSILFEFSIVSVPSDADSTVTARRRGVSPDLGTPPSPGSLRLAALNRARLHIYEPREPQ